MTPSHGLQLFTNCPNMGPFHGVQSFRNTLLQRGSPTGSQTLPLKPAPALAPLSTGPQGLAGAYCSARSPRGHSLLQAPTCSGMGSLPQVTGGYLLHHGPPWAARGQPVSPWSFIMSCKGRLSTSASRAPPLPTSSLTLVSAELFLSHSLTPLSSLPFHCNFFFPFLNMLSQRHCHRR